MAARHTTEIGRSRRTYRHQERSLAVASRSFVVMTNDINVFICYSRQDIEYFEQLQEVVSALRINKNIQTWTDQEIQPGEFWDTKIQAKLYQSNIVIMLLSTSFYASSYIQTREMQIAIENHKQDKCRIIPIKARTYPSELAPYLESMSRIAENDKPMSEMTSIEKDRFFAALIRHIIKMADELQLEAPAVDDLNFIPDGEPSDNYQHPIGLVRDDTHQTSEEYDSEILIDTIHSGHIVPPSFARLIDSGQFRKMYFNEKDWGADCVAAQLARELRLSGYHKVFIARSLFDFGRFPGSSSKVRSSHMERSAISFPISDQLDFREKKQIMEEYYDKISDYFENVVRGKKIKISIHTYDEHNPPTRHENPITRRDEGTTRPEFCLLYRSRLFQEQTRMPFGIFDPLYIDELGERTADDLLAHLISISLVERMRSESSWKYRVSHNYPYLLPEGSMEIRAHVWNYFHFLRDLYETRRGIPDDREAYDAVWNMLLDTNLRSSRSETLRSFIHMYRRSDTEEEKLLMRCTSVYENIRQFVSEEKGSILQEYSKYSEKLDAIAIEIRKDLVWHFGNKQPVENNTKAIAEAIASGVVRYLREHR